MINLETGQSIEMPHDRVSDERLKPIVKLLEQHPEGVYSYELERHFGKTRHELWSSLVRLHKLNVIEKHVDFRRTLTGKSGKMNNDRNENRGKAYWTVSRLDGNGGYWVVENV